MGAATSWKTVPGRPGAHRGRRIRSSPWTCLRAASPSPPASGVLNSDARRREPADAHRPRPPARPPAAGSTTLAAIVVGMLAAAIYRRGAFYPSDAFGVAVVSGLLSVIALGPLPRPVVRRRHGDGGWAGALVARAVRGGPPPCCVLAARGVDARIPCGLSGGQGARRPGPCPRWRSPWSPWRPSPPPPGIVALVWQVDSVGPARRVRSGSSPHRSPTPGRPPHSSGVRWCWRLGLDLSRPLVAGRAVPPGGRRSSARRATGPCSRLAAGACFVPARRWLAAWWPLATGVLVGVVVVASASGHLGPWPSTALLVALVGDRRRCARRHDGRDRSPGHRCRRPRRRGGRASRSCCCGRRAYRGRPTRRARARRSPGPPLRTAGTRRTAGGVGPTDRPRVGPTGRSVPGPDARHLPDACWPTAG